MVNEARSSTAPRSCDWLTLYLPASAPLDPLRQCLGSLRYRKRYVHIHSFSSCHAGTMPRFSARNAIVLVNVAILTVLFLHLKHHLWDKTTAGAIDGASSLFGDLYGDEEDGYGGGNAKDRDAVLGLDGVKSDNEWRTKDGKTLQVNGGSTSSDVLDAKSRKERKTAVVVASQASENATWIGEAFPKWERNIYMVDDPNAKLTVPKNKGRESMVYLTYVPFLVFCTLQASLGAALSNSS